MSRDLESEEVDSAGSQGRAFQADRRASAGALRRANVNVGGVEQARRKEASCEVVQSTPESCSSECGLQTSSISIMI